MAAKPQRKHRRASPKGPGWTISQFAALPEINTTPTVIRGAVKRGDITAIEFNGIQRIPPRERDRYVSVWGKQSA